jgi:ATP-dependent RNA helicase DeaD
MSFDSLGLTPEILQALEKLEFTKPTPVQEQVIPRLLKNEGDLVALAQTGTGKTAAFGLPILAMLDHEKRLPQALILSPTRELCVQIARDIKSFTAFMPRVSSVALYGGAPIHTQLRALDRGVQIVVATPGRMLDIIRRGKIDFSQIERVILDEADEMLNMGFQEDLEAILSNVPDSAHTLLFSATMPRQVAAIARNYMSNAEEITVGQRNAGAENVTHECYVVHERDRYRALKRIADFYPDMYSIVFCRTRHDTQSVAEWLIRDGYNADALHGDLSQSGRDYVMGKFRNKSLQVLVATDVAARGLDVSELTHVINYNLPDDLSSYTHRSGRTGRAGKSGVSALIINMREKGKVRRIEGMINKTFKWTDVPTGKQICEAQLLSLVGRMQQAEINHDQIDQYLPAVFKALEGMDREEIISRFVALEFNTLLGYYRDTADLSPGEKHTRSLRKESRRGDDHDNNRERQPRLSQTELFINLGHADGLNPSRLMGLINRVGGGDVPIGRINVMPKHSFFSVPSEAAEALATALSAVEQNDRQVRVSPVDRDRQQGGGGGPQRHARPQRGPGGGGGAPRGNRARPTTRKHQHPSTHRGGKPRGERS